jgi:hypothetical protein
MIMKSSKSHTKERTISEIFQDSIEAKEYIKKQIKENKPINEKKLKGSKFVQPL